MPKIRVLVVDDSAIVRKLIKDFFSNHQRIEVVAVANDPYEARDYLEKNDIDVLILDIELPKMDGLTFLNFLMKSYPLPTIIVSSIINKDKTTVIEAMEIGAVDIVPKPGGPFSIDEVLDQLSEKIIFASKVDVSKLIRTSSKIPIKQNTTKQMLSRIKTTTKIIAVGASTGSTQALEKLFLDFEIDYPPTLAVIHMPEKFTYSFAKRLDDICKVNVKEAVNGEKLQNGTIYIAPGGVHMTIQSHGKDHYIKTGLGPKILNQRPAVDMLFHSMAKIIGKNAIGVLLTGMGRDGAEGLLNMRKNGAKTIAQDEATSIVFGMPKEAIELGAADFIVPLPQIANKIKFLLKN